MTQPEIEIGRRTSSRTPLRLQGIFLTGARSFQCEVRDVSLTGALVATPKPISARAGILIWANHKTYAQVAWQDEGMFGLFFEAPISAEDLKEIISLSGSVLAAKTTAPELQIPEWESRRQLLDLPKIMTGEKCNSWDYSVPNELDPWIAPAER